MGDSIFVFPQCENRSVVLGAAILLSLLLHGLFMGSHIFSLSLPCAKLTRDQGINIDLESLESPAAQEASSAALPEPAQTHKEWTKNKRLENPEASPVLKETPPKAEKIKPKQTRAKLPPDRQAATVKNPGESAVRVKDAKSLNTQTLPVISKPVPAGGSTTPKPPYPDLARKRGQEGTVNIHCNVDASGIVSDASIAKSSGYKLLDEAALKTVRKWKFKPASSNGVNVAGTAIVPVQFKLQ